MAAPATVSGKRPSSATGAMCWEGERDAWIREARRPAVASNTNRTGICREGSMATLSAVNPVDSMGFLYHVLSPAMGRMIH